MTENLHQPRNHDAVLGGQVPAPSSGAVLGGLEGVKRRLDRGGHGGVAPTVDQRIAALKDALKYQQSGLDLVIQSLKDESDSVQRVAYLLLRERAETEVRKALNSFNAYQFFECLRTIKGGVSIAISPDAETLAGLRGKTIRVWNQQAGELLYTIDKYPRSQESFIISSDGEILVRSINGASHLVEIWQAGERLHSLYGHEERIAAIALSPDRQIIASGGFDKTIKVWHLKTGKLLFTIGSLLTWGTHKEAVLCLALSPDGQTLASGSADRTIKLWNLRNRNLICTLKGHLSCIQSIVISPDGRILASGSRDRTIKLWNVSTGQALHTLTGHEDSVSCLAFSWDGQTLVSGSQDKTIKVWGIL